MSGAGAAAVCLASASPRRRALLRQLGIECVVAPADVDESPRPGEEAAAHALRLALAKARRVWAQAGGPGARPVVAADTVVSAGGQLLGKPLDLADCQRMFALYSGRWHEVLTAVAVVSAAGEDSALSRSEVSFRVVGPDEVEAYWRSGEPADKAGGYAIQGRAAAFIRELRGSYSGVMGLPLFEVAQLLRAHGVSVPAGGEVHR